MKKMLRLLAVLLLFPLLSFSQKPAKPSAADLHQAIKKLNVLGSVLYVAAHPDDENQRLISYCANQRLFDVTYLSLTRGDGGQNLIGPELRELLGVLRTEELLMARSVDGGRQRFSRANDFGFSKNPEETLHFWNKDAVLADVVWAMRQTQPDVVINRFYHDKKYDTHGHHTASAMLSVEAFGLAGKADVYPEQLSFTEPWQPVRQFFNTSWFFYGSQEAFAKMDKSNLYPLDLGVYLPLKGKSNNEVAAEARSMHRCQGFGSLSGRGESVDWFDFVQGERPLAGGDVFAGINTSWTRVEGGAPISELLGQVDHDYRDDNPAASVPALIQAMQMIKTLPDGHWKRRKLADIKEVIRGCLGLYFEATAAEPAATPGDPVKLRLEIINRSAVPVMLAGFSVRPALLDTVTAATLPTNKSVVFDKTVRLPADAPPTTPYWLREPSALGMYNVDNQLLRGLPETPRYATVRWSVTVNDVPLEFDTDVAYKAGEPALGEVWRPFEVLPPVFVEFDEGAYVLPLRTRTVQVRVRAGRDHVSGTVAVQEAAPAGQLVVAGTPAWHTREGAQTFQFEKKGEEKTLTFHVEGPLATGQSHLIARAEVNGMAYTNRLATIKYDHIPQQSVLLPASASVARLDLHIKAKNIGYYMGAGDDVPAALRQMGCTVTLLEDEDMETANLKKFDAVVLGIRAYTKPAMKFHQPKLFAYVQNGGNLIVQYNKDFEAPADSLLAPYRLHLSGERVTDERAEVRFTLPNHPALTTPNRLTAADFSGWVQERGLYFPNSWDAAFAAPLSMNDLDQKPANGALLIARSGKGNYIYTSLSFFRELPAGVPGAYRLFANLLSLGK